ncbi:MAG TPA: hypothetical protein VGG75_35395 [Trebonia sp.]|jgi:hypothetical protein
MVEKRTIRTRVVRINKHKKVSALKKFWRRHPYLYSVVATIAVFAVVTLAVALIENAANQISGKQTTQASGQNQALPPLPPLPPDTSSRSDTSPPTLSTTTAAPTAPPPAPVITVPKPSPTAEATEDSKPFSSGDCITGNFENSTPTGVHKVSCSDEGAYEVLASYPGDDEDACEEVDGAELAYIQEELEDGAVVWSYTQCLGRP